MRRARAEPGQWIPPWCGRRSDAAVRLFCLPYAGGGASTYWPWLEQLPPEIDLCPIELPGRGVRYSEPRPRTLDTLADVVATALAPYVDRPCAIFGHSMGALIGYELAVCLERRWPASLVHLLVSGSWAPHRPPVEQRWDECSDAEFRERLRRLGGTPDEVLDDQELSAWLLPTLKDDLAMCDRYVSVKHRPLACALTVFGGSDDPVASTDDMLAWRDLTVGPFQTQMFPGGHFYIHTATFELCRAIEKALNTPNLHRIDDTCGAEPSRE